MSGGNHNETTDKTLVQDSIQPATNTSVSVVSGSTLTDLQTLHDQTMSAGLLTGGVINDVGGGNITVDLGTGLIRAAANGLSPVLPFDFPALASTAIPLDTTRFVGVEYNAGSPQVVIKTANIWDNFTEFSIGVAINEGGSIFLLNDKQSMNDFNGLLLERIFETDRVARDNFFGGLVLGESNDNNRNMEMTAGAIWVRISRRVLNAVDTSAADTFDRYYRDGASGHTLQASQTQWNNLNYDDGTGTLAAVAVGNYAVQWFYIDSSNELVSIFGTNEYATLADASQEAPPSDVPSRVSQRTLLLGRIIFQQAATIPELVESSFNVVFSLGGVSSHLNLTDIGSNTHAQIDTHLGNTNNPHATFVDDDGAEATGNVSTTSATYVLVGSMTVTPAAGTYIAMFSSYGFGTANGQDMEYAIFNNGSIVANSHREMDFNSGAQGSTLHETMHSQARNIVVNGSQAIDVRFQTATGTFTVGDRSLILIRTA